MERWKTGNRWGQWTSNRLICTIQTLKKQWKAKREQGENMGYSHEIQPFIQQAFWNPVNTSLYSMVIELQPLQGCWPTKNCIITDSYDTTNWSCESADRDYFQSLSNSREFELHSFHTFLFQCVIHHPRTPTCGHFIALSQYWEMVESCLESTSGFINITIVWYTHCAPAPASGS